jgi:hypothetical protein
VCTDKVDNLNATFNPQEVGITVWAPAPLDMTPADSLRGALWAAAAREALSMTPQAVSNTVWALVALGTPPM